MKSWWNAIIDLIKNTYQAFIDFITDFFYKAFDTILSLVHSAYNSIPVPAFLQNYNPWNGFPPEFYYILDKLNVGLCLSIIAAAWGIRFLINLIPVVRV